MVWHAVFLALSLFLSAHAGHTSDGIKVMKTPLLNMKFTVDTVSILFILILYGIKSEINIQIINIK